MKGEETNNKAPTKEEDDTPQSAEINDKQTKDAPPKDNAKTNTGHDENNQKQPNQEAKQKRNEQAEGIAQSIAPEAAQENEEKKDLSSGNEPLGSIWRN